MGNKVSRTVSISHEANARIIKGTNGVPWNASLLVEESVWAKDKAERIANGGSPETEDEIARKAATEAEEKARTKFRKTQSKIEEKAQKVLKEAEEKRLGWIEKYAQVVTEWLQLHDERGTKSVAEMPDEWQKNNEKLYRVVRAVQKDGLRDGFVLSYETQKDGSYQFKCEKKS